MRTTGSQVVRALETRPIYKTPLESLTGGNKSIRQVYIKIMKKKRRGKSVQGKKGRKNI